jgi:anti-sigma B factor antagonist
VDEKLRIEIRNGTDPVEVSLIGSIDVAGEGHLLDMLSLLAGQEVIVDLSRAGFIDSSGVRALLVGHKETEAAGGSLALRAPPPEIARVLELTAMDRVIRIIG